MVLLVEANRTKIKTKLKILIGVEITPVVVSRVAPTAVVLTVVAEAREVVSI